MRSLIRLGVLLLVVTFTATPIGHALEPPLPKSLGCFKDTSVLDLDG